MKRIFGKSMALHWLGLLGATTLGSAMLVSPASAAGGGITNGDFSSPGTNGATPTGWTAAPLGADTAPFSNSISEFDSAGQFPPPTPLPTGATWASEAFYDVGSTPGVDGAGGSQVLSGVDQSEDPQVGFSVAQSFAPTPGHAAWAGSVFEVDLTSGGQSFVLRYFNPFTPLTGSYTGGPTSSGSTAYIVGTPLANKVWFTQSDRDLNADVNSAFGLSNYSVTGVKYGDLEDAVTTSTSPFPNETSFWTLLSLSPGPGVGTPETPVVVALPVIAVLLFGGTMIVRRRRSLASLTTSESP
jgi:hypothetical protein